MKFKESVLGKVDEAFALGGGALRYQGSLCVPNVDDLRNRILNEAHGSCYSIQLGSTKIYHTLGDSFGGKV